MDRRVSERLIDEEQQIAITAAVSRGANAKAGRSDRGAHELPRRRSNVL